ncbi:MAG: hypothetical protein WCC95_08175 [Candidatus Sulfotelmatobacter sp.]
MGAIAFGPGSERGRSGPARGNVAAYFRAPVPPAEAVGLQTAATLRQHFSRTLDTTPSAYRRRFSTT